MKHETRPRNLAVGICPVCGKRSYTSRRAARRAARALHPAAVLRAYRCGQHWHVGHNPPWLKRGLSRGEAA